jgi:hypothetical protein
MAALQRLSPPDRQEGGISEAASEIQPEKRKRGRPKLYPFWDIAIGSNAKSDHGILNSGFAFEAVRVLFRHRIAHPEVLELTGLARE